MARAPMPAPQLLESPTVRRSAMLAKLLEEQRQPVQITGGYGELAARLLGQGITAFASNRADKAARTERDTAANTQRQALLSALGGGSAPAPVTAPSGPVGQGPALANIISPPAAPAPTPASPAPIPDPTVPVAGPTMQGVMPSAPVPAAAPAPQVPAAAPASPPSPAQVYTDGPTPQEIALITEAVNSGDPGRLEWAQQVWGEIQNRQSAPPEWKDVSVNGVPMLRDQRGNTRALFEGGIPTETMARNATVTGDNPYGVPGGTGISLDPFNRPQIVGTPPAGYTREQGGGLTPEVGGDKDITSPSRSFQELASVRQEIRPILDQATQLQRNINAVRSGLRQANGAGDIAMVNGLQKLIDEGVVREGDVALQLQSQGIQGGIAGLTQYLTSQGRFDDRIRQQLSAAAEDLYKNMNNVYAERALGYAPLVNRTFGDGAFDDILPPSTREAFGWTSPVPTGGRDRRAPSRPQGPAPRPSGNNGNTLRQQFTPEQALAERQRRQREGG